MNPDSKILRQDRNIDLISSNNKVELVWDTKILTIYFSLPLKLSPYQQLSGLLQNGANPKLTASIDYKLSS